MVRKLTPKQIAAGFGGKRAQAAQRGHKRTKSKSSKASTSTSSARSRAARKAARTRSKMGYRVRRWVRKHPVATTVLGVGGAGGTALAVSPGARTVARSAVARITPR